MNRSKTVLGLTFICHLIVPSMNQEKVYIKGRDYYLDPFKSKYRKRTLLEEQRLTTNEEYANKEHTLEKDLKDIFDSLPIPEVIAAFCTQRGPSLLNSSITNTLFKHLTIFSNLTYLALYHVNLETLNGIESLRELTTLKYHGDLPLSSLKALPLLKKLKKLTLCADLKKVHDFFILPKSLVVLDLSHNFLTVLPGIKQLSILKMLNISSNCLSQIDKDALPLSLLYLDASFNRIKDIELSNYKKLKVLWLNNNRIEDPKYLLSLILEGNLISVNLTENPLCLKNFKKLLTELNQPTVIKELPNAIEKYKVLLSLQNLSLDMTNQEKERLLRKREKIDKKVLAAILEKKEIEKIINKTTAIHTLLKQFKSFSSVKKNSGN